MVAKSYPFTGVDFTKGVSLQFLPYFFYLQNNSGVPLIGGCFTFQQEAAFFVLPNKALKLPFSYNFF